MTATGLRTPPSGGEKAMPEYPNAVTLKQNSAQLAIQAPPFAVFPVCVSGVLWAWSQSGIDAAADISVGVAAPAANPLVAGSSATDKPISTANMVRPMRMDLSGARQHTSAQLQIMYGT